MLIQLWIILLVSIVCSIVSFLRYSNYGRGLIRLKHMELWARKLKQIKKKSREIWWMLSIENVIIVSILSNIFGHLWDQSIINFLWISLKIRIALIIVPLYELIIHREIKPTQVFFITAGHYIAILITASILLGILW